MEDKKKAKSVFTDDDEKIEGDVKQRHGKRGLVEAD